MLAGIITNFSQAKLAKSQGADILELRLDLVKKNNLAYTPHLLKKIKKQLKLPVILTIRKKSEGGNYSGPDSGRTELFFRLLPLSDYIDLEITSLNSFKKVISLAKKHNNKLILSYHDFKKTPADSQLQALFDRAANHGPFITKFACFNRNLSDLSRLLVFCKTRSKSAKISVIPMGKYSQPGRVICALLGSYLTYGFVEAPVVSSQLSLKQLKLLLK